MLRDFFLALSQSEFMQSQLLIVIYGKVTGVSFRSSAKKEAENLGLNGYARNIETENGDAVEIMLEGEEDVLSEFLAWATKGPKGAKVKEIEFNYREYSGEFSGFEVVEE